MAKHSDDKVRAVSDAAINWAWIALAVYRDNDPDGDYRATLESAAVELEDAFAALNPTVNKLSGLIPPPPKKRKPRKRLAK